MKERIHNILTWLARKVWDSKDRRHYGKRWQKRIREKTRSPDNFRKPFSREEIKAMIVLYDSGEKVVDIALKIRRSYSSVRGFIDKARERGYQFNRSKNKYIKTNEHSKN